MAQLGVFPFTSGVHLFYGSDHVPKPIGVFKSLNTNARLIRHKTPPLPRPHTFRQPLSVLIDTDHLQAFFSAPGLRVGATSKDSRVPVLETFSANSEELRQEEFTVLGGHCVQLWNSMNILLVFFFFMKYSGTFQP